MASEDKFKRMEKDSSTDASDINDQKKDSSVNRNSASKTEDELLGLPVDRGWAWMILFATIMEAFIYGGIMRSYGVFFVQFQMRFGSSAAETSLIQTVFNIAISVSGIIVMTIGMKHMTARTSVIIGTVATTGAYIVATFATRIEVLIFTLGAVAGVAVAMITLPLLSMIGIYFNKRRGLANSFTTAGVSLGSLVFGPLYPVLFEYYGYHGTMLITVGFLLNIMICGCLLRPPEFHTKRKGNIPNDSEHEMEEIVLQKTNVDDDIVDLESDRLLITNSLDKIVHLQEQEGYNSKDKDVRNRDIYITQKPKYVRTLSEPQEATKPPASPSFAKQLPQVVALNFQKNRSHSFDQNKARDHTTTSPLVQGTRVFDTTSESNIALFSAADVMYGSLTSLSFINAESNDQVLEEIIQDSEKHLNRTWCQTFKCSVINVLRIVFDVSLLKDPVFIHFVVFASISFPAPVLTNVYFIPFAKDIGISNQNISVILFVVGAVDFVGRISVGVFADRKILKPTTFITCGFAIMAVVNNLTRLISSFWTILLFVVIQGFLGGIYNSLFAVTLIEHVGIAKFKSSLGFANMLHGASVALFFLIAGLLRDKTGAYYWTYHMLSILLIIGAVLAFTLPLTYKRTRKPSTEYAK